MGATEYTDKLRLPVFHDDDKPSWLGDHNDMVRKIDNGFTAHDEDIRSVNNIASSALNLATSANETIESTATNVATQIANDTLSNVNNRISTIQSSMESFLAQHANDGATYYVNAVDDIGLSNNRASNCSETLRNYMAEHSEGGIIIFPQGEYLFSTPFILNRSISSAPWAFIGMGSQDISTDDDGSNATNTNITTTGGTRFVNNVGNNTGMLILNHEGHLVINGIQFISETAGMVPFIDAEGTTSLIENCSFRGPVSSYHNSSQVGVNYGTFGSFTQGGYGQAIRNCSFDRVGRALQIYNGTNGLRVDNIVGSSKCGNSGSHSAFIHCDGTGGILKEMLITNIIIESHAYNHCIYMKGIDKNVFINVQGWDNSWMQPNRFLSAFYFDGNAVTNNIIINPLAESSVYYTTSESNSNQILTRGNKFIAGEGVSANFYNGTSAGPQYPTMPGLAVEDGSKLRWWDGSSWQASK